MTEHRAPYITQPNPLHRVDNNATMDTELDVVRSQLTDIECQLISLLVTVQRALGKEPSVMTRRERRRG